MLSGATIQKGSSLRSALQFMNDGSQRVCFILEGKRLVGVLTDGDIRRALLKGVTIECAVEDAMTTDYFSMPYFSSIQEIQKKLNDYEYIPIVDKFGDLIDISTRSKINDVPLIEPSLNGNEASYVSDCIRTGWVSSQGKYIREFEENFSKYTGSKYSLAVSNGTVALHLALLACGIKSDDEVIAPNLTFAAPINAILYAGATPVLVDVDLISKNIGIEAIESAITKKTKAIIVVHLYGYPAKIQEIVELARKHNLYVIEDCAEALGTLYRGKHVGIFGDVGCFSFYGNKTITTGEGGMLITNNEVLINKASLLRDHGMDKKRRYWHLEVGYNYRMTNLQAALGVAQMERVRHFVNRKREIAKKYQEFLDGRDDVIHPLDSLESVNSYWLYTIMLKDFSRGKRDQLLEELSMHGIESRPVFYPADMMPIYKKYANQNLGYLNSRKISEQGLSLPTGVSMGDESIKRVCEALIMALENIEK